MPPPCPAVIPPPAGVTLDSLSPILHKRFIGEIDADEDGSFNVRIPANIPIQIQALDAAGMALRTSAWIWARNREQRGCIGCHEDGERTPEKRHGPVRSHETPRT